MKENPLIFSLFNNNDFANAILQKFKYEFGEIEFHQFPDQETLVKINNNVNGQDVIFITNLEKPNCKLLPLIFAAETVKDLGARKIGLIAPYLPYMRQDKQFHMGEGISSSYFAKIISTYFDGLITIDPHLHRWHSLNNLYNIPTHVLHATQSIATWIKHNTVNPLLIGPDSESTQWVAEIAQITHGPFIILEKTRKGDRLVEVSHPDIERHQNYTPILVDDIVSTASTMIKTIEQLKLFNMPPPICIGVHALFSDKAYDDLLKAGAGKIITCNTVPHQSNAIDLSHLIAQSIKGIFKS